MHVTQNPRILPARRCGLKTGLEGTENREMNQTHIIGKREVDSLTSLKIEILS